MKRILLALVLALSLCVCAALRGAGESRTPLWINLCGSLVNTLLHAALISGRLGFPGLGIRGAAGGVAAGGGTAFTLGPNPAKDGVRLEVAAEGFRGGVLAVADAAGREVLRRELKASERVCEFRVADLPAGTYFVTLTTKEGTSTRKLVVE